MFQLMFPHMFTHFYAQCYSVTHVYTREGPEKYRERGNDVPRKAALWQEGSPLAGRKGPLS
jgi:hypothetical protein